LTSPLLFFVVFSCVEKKEVLLERWREFLSRSGHSDDSKRKTANFIAQTMIHCGLKLALALFRDLFIDLFQ
jgi:hypothetical protein